MRRLLVATLFATGAVIASGCAGARGAASRPAVDPAPPPADVQPATTENAPAPVPPLKVAVQTIEQQDPELAAELVALKLAPSGASHRAVADRYRALGVPDAAYDHYRGALTFDARDAAAHEGLARVWRDWGFPEAAMGPAYRAVFYAPDSASAHNTMGTVLQALGQFDEAKDEYGRAAQLDPHAAYAVSNLCYLSFLEGALDDAVSTCQSALALDPAFSAARHNLALAHAAAGRLDLARSEFLDAGGGAVASFNMGIVYMAVRDYARAAASFDAASRANPAMNIARERAAEARRLSRAAGRDTTGESK